MEQFFNLLADHLFSLLARGRDAEDVRLLTLFSWVCYHQSRGCVEDGGEVDVEILAETLRTLGR